jgi:hypothetical protein
MVEQSIKSSKSTGFGQDVFRDKGRKDEVCKRTHGAKRVRGLSNEQGVKPRAKGEVDVTGINESS